MRHQDTKLRLEMEKFENLQSKIQFGGNEVKECNKICKSLNEYQRISHWFKIK